MMKGIGPDYVLFFIVLIQFVIFVLSLWVIYKLWMAVTEFLGQKTTAGAKILATGLGRAEVGESRRGLKLKAVGAGLGGTVAILALAVIALYVLGHHIVTPR